MVHEETDFACYTVVSCYTDIDFVTEQQEIDG